MRTVFKPQSEQDKYRKQSIVSLETWRASRQSISSEEPKFESESIPRKFNISNLKDSLSTTSITQEIKDYEQPLDQNEMSSVLTDVAKETNTFNLDHSKQSLSQSAQKDRNKVYKRINQKNK